ncbi:flagellar basal-body rod protein FlgG [Stenotrophomonas sp. SPM]|uniref:flagellar hook-basal body protein n=1 Tax=Stenotrophomonas sp. SPM TaxID=2170735 RepID=UPI000DE6F47F|nr:flagellar hook-basal body protein [Stenotrophomonas sp. SPM]PWB29848.1 flagellar basal-body rod protein FlgG [Stenotrophomonas sp. SPM]
MIDALHIAASGLRSGQQQLDTISNNVANLQTPGFKRGRVNFADIATPLPALGADPQTVIAEQRPGGVRIISTSTSFEPGEMRQTGNALDVAIDGAGFYEFEAADGGLVYSRSGQFRVDEDGFLRNYQGLRLSGDVQIPREGRDMKISAEGEVSVQMPDEVDRTVVGTIEVVRFAAAESMRSIGDNLYAVTPQAGSAVYGRAGSDGAGRLRQGQMEMANVEIIEEMSGLVLAQRAYQLNARVLQAADQVMDTINNLRR